MALQLANFTHQGFTAEAAYADINFLSFDRNQKNVQIQLSIWASKEYHDAGNNAADVKVFTVTGELLAQILPTELLVTILTNALTGLQALPEAQSLLQGSTVIDTGTPTANTTAPKATDS